MLFVKKLLGNDDDMRNKQKYFKHFTLTVTPQFQ